MTLGTAQKALCVFDFGAEIRYNVFRRQIYRKSEKYRGKPVLEGKAMERKKAGGGMMFLISFCAILLVCAVGAVLVMTMGQDAEVMSSREDGGEEGSQSGVPAAPGVDVNAVLLSEEEPEEYNPEGFVQYQINALPFFSSGSQAGTLMISSSAANVDRIRVEITLEEDDRSVYQSDFILPGYGIPTAKLAVKLRDGVYPAIATIRVYDADGQEYPDVLKEALTLCIGVSEEE